MIQRDAPIRLGRGVDDDLCVANTWRKGLLAEHMRARSERRQADIHVRARWRRDDHCVERTRCERGVERFHDRNLVLRRGAVTPRGIGIDANGADALESREGRKVEIVTGVAQSKDGDSHVATFSVRDIDSTRSG